MAARWLALLPASKPAPRFNLERSRRAIVPYRRRGFWRRPSVIALRGIGWFGAIACAFAFNALLFRDMVAPDAQASIVVEQLTAPNPDDLHLLAATMWGEARSEGENGMRAVAHVMVNRVGPRFGEDLRSVILAPKQFSVWNRGDPNRPLVQNPERYAKAKEDSITWQAAQRIAFEVLSGASADPTHGALFYHTRTISPSWSRYGVGTATIGAHTFYRDVPNRRARVRRLPDGAGATALRAALRAPPRSAAIAAHRVDPSAGRVRGVIQHRPDAAAAQSMTTSATVESATAAENATSPPSAADVL